MTGYLVAILTFVSLAVLLGFALNVQWGQAGMINFGLAGFYGVGAYTAAILSKQGADGFTATAAAIGMTAILGYSVPCNAQASRGLPRHYDARIFRARAAGPDE